MKPGVAELRCKRVRGRVEEGERDAIADRREFSGFYQTTMFQKGGKEEDDIDDELEKDDDDEKEVVEDDIDDDDEESVLQHGVNIHVFVARNLAS